MDNIDPRHHAGRAHRAAGRQERRAGGEGHQLQAAEQGTEARPVPEETPSGACWPPSIIAMLILFIVMAYCGANFSKCRA